MSFIIMDPRNKYRLHKEWVELYHKNLPLFHAVEELSRLVHRKAGKFTVVTCVYRSQEENDGIYKGHHGRPKKTAHSVWAAVDIRSRGLEGHITELVDHMNKSFNGTNANGVRGGNTALFHEIKGHGPHFHIQYQERHSKHIHRLAAGESHE